MITQEHLGKRTYNVKCTRRFKDGKEFDRELQEYCDRKGYVCSGNGDKTPEAVKLQQYMEKKIKEAFNTEKDVRLVTVGLDPKDINRIQFYWGEEFGNVMISTFCGIWDANLEDYTEKAKEFSRDFLGGYTFDYVGKL